MSRTFKAIVAARGEIIEIQMVKRDTARSRPQRAMQVHNRLWANIDHFAFRYNRKWWIYDNEQLTVTKEMPNRAATEMWLIHRSVKR